MPNYEDIAANTIRKRQLHLSCATSVAMIVAAVGIAAGTVWLGIEYGVFPFMFLEVIAISHLVPNAPAIPVIPALLATAGACIALYLGIKGIIDLRDAFHELSEMKASEPNTDMNGVSTQNQEKVEEQAK